jgi:hypothetical protein
MKVIEMMIIISFHFVCTGSTLQTMFCPFLFSARRHGSASGGELEK